MIEHLVFLLEEPSAEDFLRGVLPHWLPPGVVPHFLVFEGKQDLEKQLVRRLKNWRNFREVGDPEQTAWRMTG